MSLREKAARWNAWALPLALAVSVAAGCADDADRARNGGSTTSTTTVTTADASVDTDTAAFCERARSFDGIGIDPQNPDPAEIGRTAEALEELSLVAPEEIRSKVSSAGQLLGEFSDLMASVDLSDPAAVSDPAFQEKLASLQERDSTLGPDLEEIARFIEEECAA